MSLRWVEMLLRGGGGSRTKQVCGRCMCTGCACRAVCVFWKAARRKLALLKGSWWRLMWFAGAEGQRVEGTPFERDGLQALNFCVVEGRSWCERSGELV